MKTTAEKIELARKHIGLGSMVSSARLCLDDAERLLARGESAGASHRALESLAYSVGIFHPDFRAAGSWPIR